MTVPKVIASGENITVPAGRVAILPNVQVDGTLNIEGEVFIPSGATFSKVVETEGNQTIAGVKTFSSPITGSISGNAGTVTNGVYTTGNQTIDGVKTFSSSPVVPTPTTGIQVANKEYVDTKVSKDGTGATGTWGINVTGNASTATNVAWSGVTSKPTSLSGYGITDSVKNFGTVTVQGVAGNDQSCTTAQFITWLSNMGALSQSCVMKCSWNYSGNNDISDTGFGTLETAGCFIEVMSDSAQYIIRITSPSTGTGAGGIHEYVNHGTSYSPGWRRVYTSNLNGNISGNAATATKLNNSANNWNESGAIGSVVGMLAWKNYSNSHVIFDASNGTSPAGTAVNNTNADAAWSPSYPTLMGWNGSNTYGVRVDSARTAGAFSTTSGSAPSYACRAWVNFNGTGTVAIRASGNVSSITDNGTGDYSIKFTTAMPDANYSIAGWADSSGRTIGVYGSGVQSVPATNGIRVTTAILGGNTTPDDSTYVNVLVIR